MSAPITRKNFLRLSAAAMGGAMLAGCGMLSTKPSGTDTPASGGSSPSELKEAEAPSLAARVKSGDLPPMAERIPKTPLTITPHERVGTYGGIWNTALLGAADTAWLWRTVGYDRIVVWDFDWKKIVPNVAESFESSPDATTYTFKLREGMKWSDGKPFTADDIMFWYEAIFSNDTLTPGKAVYLKTDEHPVVVTSPDPLTAVFTFKEPNGVFLQWLATYDAAFDLTPKHYLSQFHKDYNPDVETLVKKEKASDWSELFLRKVDPWNNPDSPRLSGWTPTNAVSDGTRMVFKRNPYYFKVDTNGNQLPYLDQVVYTIFTEEEAMLLQATNGDFDMHARGINIPRNKPVLADARKKGNFDFIDMPKSDLNSMKICPNLNHTNPARRKMLNDKQFRIGMSYGIDRQQIIDIVYKGQGEPWQIAPRPESPFYTSKDMGKQYTEHDPDKANSILDAAGYDKRDSSGTRLDSAGKPISLTVLTQTRYFEMADALQLMVAQLAKIGIKLTVSNIDGNLLNTRVIANDFDLAADTGEYGYLDAIVDPRDFFPSFLSGASEAPSWYRWYAGIKPAEEPPASVRKQMDLYRQDLQASTDRNVQYRVMNEIVTIAKDDFHTFGIALPPNSYGIVRNDFHNVPKSMWEAARYLTPGPSQPCQYFTDRKS